MYKYIIPIIFSILLIGFVVISQASNDSSTVLKGNTPIENNEQSDNKFEEQLTKDDIVDSENYINNNIDEPFLRNIFLTVLDVNVWLFNNGNNPALISQHANDVMNSTFCLASSITPSQRVHMHEMINLLVGYDPDLSAQHQAISINMQQKNDLPVPDKSDYEELCSVFENYPAEGFEFSYRGN